MQIMDKEISKQEAFMELYTPLNARLSRYAEAMTKDRETAKDLVSETILIAFERFHTLEKKESFLYFLFGIASNLFKQTLRRKKWWDTFNQDKAEQIASDATRPDVHADVAILYEALEKMPVKYRTPLVLFELSGLTIKEIAEVEGLTESGVKSRLLRGREQLTTLLGGKTQAQQKITLAFAILIPLILIQS